MKLTLLMLTIFILVKTFSAHRGWLRVYDVGQGDAIVISLPTSEMVVIDGGGNIEIDRYLSMEWLFSKCKIDTIILTHPHYDHIRGLTRLLRRCEVDNVLHYPVDYESSEYVLWQDMLQDINTKEAVCNDVIKVGDARMHVLGPCNYTKGNFNNASVIVLFQYLGFDALFVGDAEVEELETLDYDYIVKNIVGKLDVLKVGHHGARNAYLPSWTAELHPEMCLISVGEGNKYGHPHDEAIEFYQKIGCEIKRTDYDGTIELLLE